MPSYFANVQREVRRRDRLAGSALGREHGHDPAAARRVASSRRRSCGRSGWPCGSRRRRSRSSAAGGGRRTRQPRAPAPAGRMPRRKRAGSQAPACARGSPRARPPASRSCACRGARLGGGHRSSVAADSVTPSLQPTISTSEWRPRASRSSARPSQLPVTKTRTFSRVVTEVSRLMAGASFQSGTDRREACEAGPWSSRRRGRCPTIRTLPGYRQRRSSA